MLVSTKGRYALRVMLELAQDDSAAYLPLPAIAERQCISEKYLESIISVLSKAGLVDGLRGKGGGYRLTREPSDYSIGEIIRAADGSLSCLGTNVQLTRCEVSSGLSAVSTGSQVLNLVTFVVTQFAMGITVLIARYLGEKKPQYIGQVIGGRMARLASEAVQTGVSVAQSKSGEVTVSVPSGYRFFIVRKQR